jgi:hypothetical protein
MELVVSGAMDSVEYLVPGVDGWQAVRGYDFIPPNSILQLLIL